MLTQEVTKKRLQLDRVTLDMENRQVSGPNGIHHLTRLECRLLKELMLRPRQVVSRAYLMKTIWKTDYLGDTRTLEVHVCGLRKKIEANPRNPEYLRTVRGMGYSFVVD